MDYITSTELRTKTSELIGTLEKGKSIEVIHRSKIIGIIKPLKQTESKTITLKDIEAFQKAFRPKRIIPRNKRTEIYRKHLVEKYG